MKLSRLNEQNNPQDRYMFNNPVTSRGIGKQDDSKRPSANYDGGYPGSSTGGTRTSPGKVAPDGEDFEQPEVDIEDNVPPIMKEPNDGLSPKVANHRGPGA